MKDHIHLADRIRFIVTEGEMGIFIEHDLVQDKGIGTGINPDADIPDDPGDVLGATLHKGDDLQE